MSPSVLRAVVVDSDAEMRAAIRRVLSAVPDEPPIHPTEAVRFTPENDVRADIQVVGQI